MRRFSFDGVKPRREEKTSNIRLTERAYEETFSSTGNPPKFDTVRENRSQAADDFGPSVMNEARINESVREFGL